MNNEMKTLSKNNVTLNLIIQIILILIVNSIVFVAISKSIQIKFIVLTGITTLGLIWIYKRYKNTYNLFFNEKYLNLKNRKRERNINLKNIKKIKLTLSDMRIMGLQYYEYKIEFTNENGIFESIRFFISDMNSKLWEFQDLVKKNSSNIVIENKASS
tara:strand:- start:1044 stop:1517 length:474 start_codon:yes stop_codon:yes gene_type:complete